MIEKCTSAGQGKDLCPDVEILFGNEERKWMKRIRRFIVFREIGIEKFAASVVRVVMPMSGRRSLGPAEAKAVVLVGYGGMAEYNHIGEDAGYGYEILSSHVCKYKVFNLKIFIFAKLVIIIPYGQIYSELCR